jgi:hypothetical protein
MLSAADHGITPCPDSAIHSPTRTVSTPDKPMTIAASLGTSCDGRSNCQSSTYIQWRSPCIAAGQISELKMTMLTTSETYLGWSVRK